MNEVQPTRAESFSNDLVWTEIFFRECCRGNRKEPAWSCWKLPQNSGSDWLQEQSSHLGSVSRDLNQFLATRSLHVSFLCLSGPHVCIDLQPALKLCPSPSETVINRLFLERCIPHSSSMQQLAERFPRNTFNHVPGGYLLLFYCWKLNYCIDSQLRHVLLSAQEAPVPCCISVVLQQ